ncbi:helicase-exonuclease AddAB subunit AddB [Petralouisia muris]|uniref:Helicase-exonuclease AddAB subunit AddB n=1 Tax=Petralouisia muris TaxID=3032872 RepID=A0AC61S1J7_9FIRM|nr:PD-(D/E)XK nuclease family protein [Petralouisia muris]TGY98115.1 helicase-exonuclease AddAB subunit AddB [Petralouisia muris]
MSLQLIFGGSGSGKSDYVYRRLLEQSKIEKDKTFFVLVPEQFTMQTQRELVRRQENHSIMNVDVVSFPRLAYRVFDELGMGKLSILEETGKNLLLRRVAEEQQENLKLLKASMKKTGYISEVKSVISELTQYRILPGQLDAFIQDEEQSPLFRHKIQDIQTMYQGFLDYLEGKYITAEDLLEVLAQTADRSQILKGSVIVLDGFTGFTPVQYYLLETLLRLTDEIVVTVTLDERENPYQCQGIQELFYMSKKTIGTLLSLAERNHIEVKEPYWVRHTKNSRFAASPALLWLERNLFRFRPKPYLVSPAAQHREAEKVSLSAETAGNHQDIRFFSLLNPRQELHFIGREIKRLVREEHYRYKDIAIVCGDVELYGNYANEIFDAYQIPLFLDARKNIVFHPMTEFIRQSLLLLEQDFSYETVLGYLRCGLSGWDREQVDLLENYLLAEGIRGFKKWQEPWVRRGCVQSQEELDRINELREQFAEQFAPLRESFQKEKGSYHTVLEESRAFYLLMYQLNVEGQLKEYEEQFSQEGENALAKEYAQIYKIVMDLLDKMVELLGEERMGVREYREILEAGLEAAAVGIIPPGYDRVVFGDIERTRLSDVKVLFFVGVNDGLIPKASQHGGIISQSDREWFASHGMELAPTDRERSFIQKFYLYLNLTKPSEKLYITWFRVSQDGKEARKSYLISAMFKMFPDILPVRVEEALGMEQIVTPKSSLKFLVEGLKAAQKGMMYPEWKGLCRWYLSEELWKEKASRFLEAAFYQYHAAPVGAKVVRALYGKVLENSVTRLEQFSACAFGHFLQYGLKLEERSLGEFAPVDMGNMFHEALERYSNHMEEEGYHWFDVPEEVKERLIQQAVEETLGSGLGSMLFQEARTAYLLERMKRILRRTIEAITEQIQTSHFTPEGYEISFSFVENLEAVNFVLSEEERMRLRGRIDRIDARKEGNQVYVKVIDYKSGNREFQLLSLYHGLQLQLVVYLNSAMELMKRKYPDKEVLPGGMYYYHLDDPVVEGNSASTDAEIQEKILEELKLKGIAGEGEDSSVSKKSKKAGTEEFQILSRYVSHKIRDIGRKIFDGEIGAEPYQLGDNTGCDYCPYHGVCGFDPSSPGWNYRKLENIRDEAEILEKMRKEL